MLGWATVVKSVNFLIKSYHGIFHNRDLGVREYEQRNFIDYTSTLIIFLNKNCNLWGYLHATEANAKLRRSGCRTLGYLKQSLFSRSVVSMLPGPHF